MQRRSFLAGTAAATALGAPSRTHAQGLVTVRCGSVPLDGYGQPYYGVAAGIFRDAGIDLQVTGLANSGAIAAAITGGSLDVGLGSVSQIAGAREKGLPYTFFAPGARVRRRLTVVTVDSGKEFADSCGARPGRQNGRRRQSHELHAIRHPRMAQEERRRPVIGKVRRAAVSGDAGSTGGGPRGCGDDCRTGEDGRTCDRHASSPTRMPRSRRPGSFPSGSRRRPGSRRTWRSPIGWPGPSCRRRSGPTAIRQRRPRCSRRLRECRTTSS